MKTGDPKQAAILSVVAVFAVGFLIKSLIPDKGPAMTPRMAIASVAQAPANGGEFKEKPSAAGQAFTYPTALRRDTFSHPALEQVKVASPSKDPKPAPGSSEVPPVVPGDFEPLPDVASSDHGSEVAKPKVEPEENKRQTENNNGASRMLAIRLDGIVQATENQAILSISGESRIASVGAELAPGVRLITVEKNSITIRHNGKQKRIFLGQEVSA